MRSSPDAQEHLRVYLRDHHAAAAAGVDLARRLADENRNWDHAPELQRIATDIAEDRAVLRDVLERAGVAPSVAKVLGARTMERLARLKLNGRWTSYSPLSRVLELETLYGGINAKLALWRSLHAVRAAQSSLQPFDFERLATRATEQLNGVERLHRLALGDAFSVPADEA
jgi:hypothetical protein